MIDVTSRRAHRRRLNLLWLYVWLMSAIAASYLSDRKGYGDRPGLATGLILTAVGVIVWLIVPAKPDSKWKTQGAFARRQEGAAERLTSRLRLRVTHVAGLLEVKALAAGLITDHRGLRALRDRQPQEVGLVGALELGRRHRREHQQPGQQAADDAAAAVHDGYDDAPRRARWRA